MIVWLNGAFGVGKTSVARAIVERWRGATLVDPERIGFVLSRLPPRYRGDFQDLPAWRAWTVRTVSVAARLARHVVVPMTLVEPRYFEEIVGTLRQRGAVRHFTLVASPEVVRARLRGRGTCGWAEQQIDRCVRGLVGPRFEEYVPTERRPVAEIAASVLTSAGALDVPAAG